MIMMPKITVDLRLLKVLTLYPLVLLPAFFGYAQSVLFRTAF